MSNWKTVDRCKVCEHIYYEHTTMGCPDCGANNFKKIQTSSNLYYGNRKVVAQGIPCDDNLEKVMVRKRFLRGWEVKEVYRPPVPPRKNVQIEFPKEDEPRILELCKDYLDDTWIIVETSKTKQCKYRQLKIIESKRIGEFYITTYFTDKKEQTSFYEMIFL